MKRTDLDFAQMTAKAIAILERYPEELCPERLATQVGIRSRNPCGNHNPRSSALNTLLRHLARQGYCVEHHPIRGEQVVFGQVRPETPKPLFQASQAPECKTWIDPSFIDPTLAKSRAEKVYSPTPAPSQEEPQMSRQPKGREAVRAVLQRMIESGVALDEYQVCAEAGVGDTYLRTSPVMRTEYKTALALATTKRGGLPDPVAEPEPNADLHQQIADLEARNRELRQQLGAAQPPTDLETQIQQQIAYWEGVERDRAEVARTAVADYKAAARRVAVLKQFAASLAPEAVATQTGGVA